MLKKIEYIFNYRLYDVYLVTLGVLNVLAFVAPLASAAGLTAISRPIYFVYSFFCHQLDWRSIHLFEKQLAWCSRDTFMWLSIFIMALIIKKYKVEGIKWYAVIPFIVPMALDGGIQTIATMAGWQAGGEYYYISNNFMRMVTGSIFGIGLSLWLMPMVKDFSYANNKYESV